MALFDFVSKISILASNGDPLERRNGQHNIGEKLIEFLINLTYQAERYAREKSDLKKFSRE